MPIPTGIFMLAAAATTRAVMPVIDIALGMLSNNDMMIIIEH